MKILIDGIPRDIGGIGTLIINIVNYNAKSDKKIDFDFLVPKKSQYTSVLEQKGYRYFEVPKVCTKEYKNKVSKVFNDNLYDYVWINNTSKINIALPREAKKYGVKVIMHSHGVAAEERGLKWLVFKVIEKIQEKKYCSLIDIPFACSETSAEFFYTEELRKKCVIVSNGIEVEKFLFNQKNREVIRKELNMKDNDVVLGAVGRLTNVKNYSFLIKLMPELNDNVKLLILGDGEDFHLLQGLIRDLNLSNRVFLLGKHTDVERYLSAMDIFMMPSLNEGLPFSLVEAQANGLKCLVSTGVTEEAKLTTEVIFIDLNDKQAWISAVNKALPTIEYRVNANKEICRAGFSIDHSYKNFVKRLEERD